MEYQDLVYFGYEYDRNSKMLESEFIREVKKEFPEVVLKDAYDSIKGYRQEVYLPKSQSDIYWEWSIAHGWLTASLIGQMMMMNPEHQSTLLGYVEKAKIRYPDKFKKP